MYLSVDVRRLKAGIVASALLAALGSLLEAQSPAVNNPPAPPRSILVFPQRDFVSSSGFEASDLVTVEVFHPGSSTPASAATRVVPQDDPTTPDFDGIVEVNHPGGACWETVTPDIRPGDRVRTTRRDPFGAVLGIDETTIANVVAARPVQRAFDTVEIHGTAQNANGTPIDITQLEQRLVAPRDAFDLNGRRTLRASSVPGAEDGILTYDPVDPTNPNGIRWTAVYTGLDGADVTRALNAESRIMWLGANPGAAVEGTIYEIGADIAPGPSAPCGAPLEVLPPPPGSELVPPSNPTNVTASVTGSNTVSLNWTASTDNVGVTSYGVYRNGVAIANVQTPDGSAPAPTFYQDFNVPAGQYAYTVDAADAVGNRSARVATTPAQVETTAQVATDFPACGSGGGNACVSDPPASLPTQVQIIAFPARDFTSASGYTEQDSTVAVQVIRNGLLISSSNVIPVDDPTTVGFDGIVEVNHPGGGCWMGVTPDIRAGDVVRQIAYGADGAVRRIDQIHVANVSVERPRVVRYATPGSNDGVIEVHGTAMDDDGNPIPLGNIEQRLVAPRDRFDTTGKRTLRSGDNGTLVYDTIDNPTGMKFTATYSGLTEDDVYRAAGGTAPTSGRTFPGAESRILFLGDPPLIAPSLTIYENSDLTISGPSAGSCFAPIEAIDTQAPSTPVAAARQAGPNSVELTWSPSTDDTYVNGYGIYRRDDDVAGADFVRIRNIGASLHAGATMVTFVDTNVPVGRHTYAVDAVDSASPLKVNYPNAFAGPNTTDPILQGVEWGNRSSLGVANDVEQNDVLPPSAPANLVAQATGPASVTLTWSPSTDDVGVASYRVYRNGAMLADVTGAPPNAAFTDSIGAVTANTTFTYTVDAADAAGNRSSQSQSVTVTVTPTPDAEAPVMAGALAANTRDVYSGTAPAIGPKDVRLSWPAASDNVGVAGYGIYRRTAASVTGAAAAAPWVKVADVNGATLTYTDANLAVSTWDYAVDAVDSAGNRSDATKRLTAFSLVTVNDPPTGTHSIIPFPQRDFVSSSGYAVSEGPIVIEVIRNGKVWARSTPIDVVEDPATPGSGAAEVNHPGGGCWAPEKIGPLDGITPDLRGGDIVRLTNRRGEAEQTTTADVYAERPTDRAADGTLLPAGVIQVHGTARDAAGNPLPIEQLEHRLIASSAEPFPFNGRRAMRAPGEGSVAYDAVNAVTNPKGTRWTATYSGLSGEDIAIAMASESRAVWLGRDPLAGLELTIFENGDGVAGGPAGGVCTTPAEAGPAVTFDATGATAASFDPAARTLAFPARNTGTSVSQTLTLSNIGTADATRAIDGKLSIASAGLEYGPADFTLSSNTCTAAATIPLNGACTVSVTFNPTAAGTRVGKLVLTDNANNDPVQVFALSGEGVDAQAPTITAPAQTFFTTKPGNVMNVPGNSVPATVTAAASDVSRVASLTLEASSDGGRSWGPIAGATTTGLGTTQAHITAPFNVSIGVAYQFRAKATDSLGNASAPVVSPGYRASVSDDNSGVPRFSGSWSTQKNNTQSAGAYGNTIHTATAPQTGKTNTVTFTFNGTEVALLSSLGPDRGQITMSVDGGAAQTIDLFDGTQKAAAIVRTISGLAAGTHTVTVNVLTTRNAASTGTRVDVDAFIVKF